MPELQARALAVVRRSSTARHTVDVRALDGVDLAIRGGELVAIMGATGSGKSTLALALAGLVEPASGAVTGPATGAVGLVLQRPESSFLEERVLDEVSLAARWQGVPHVHAERRAAEELARLALPADVADRDPLALSGGEQRRVAIAAVLAGEPRVTILDEPGAGLDAAARRELQGSLAALRDAGRTLVVVTHDPAEAALLATRLVVLVAGKVAWDGPVEPVLGDPARARSLGLDVAPEVTVLHAVAAGLGVQLPGTPARPADAVRELARLLLEAPSSTAPPERIPPGDGFPDQAPPPAQGTGGPAAPLPALPPLVDARVRLVACALAVAASLMAGSLLVAAAVTASTSLVVAAARISRARVRLAVRPLVALAVLLVVLQLLVGGEASTEVVPGRSSDVPAFAALLRALQASGVVLATLALSAATATSDLAAAIRWFLRPLRTLRIPVDAASFVVATGLGLVPALADELERLRLAQRARGIRHGDDGLVARLRADALLLSPLFVAAFRRAHLLADALAVRGFDPRRATRPWRPRLTPATDLALLAGGVVLVALSRFA